MSNATPAAKPPKARTAAPIAILDSDLARLYTQLHPFITLSVYFLFFKQTVESPVSSLAKLLVPIAALQILYVALCLPATKGSSSSHQRNAASKGAPRRKAQPKTDDIMSTKVLPSLLSLTISLTAGPPLASALLILFGAPFTTHLQHTLLCSAHISLLAALPLLYVHGVDFEQWRLAAALMLPIDEVYGAVLGTLLGAWVGAVPIPLDWDRAWQKWPVTIVTGAYLGWAIGKSVGGLLLKGKVIDLSP